MKRHEFLRQTLDVLFNLNQLTPHDSRKLKHELALCEAPAPTLVYMRDPMKTRRGKLKIKGNPAFPEYQKRVHELTALQPLHILPDFEKRGFTGYHLDHIVSIFSGFKHGIPAEQIAHIDNLRMIPYKENMAKGCNSIFSTPKFNFDSA